MTEPWLPFVCVCVFLAASYARTMVIWSCKRSFGGRGRNWAHGRVVALRLPVAVRRARRADLDRLRRVMQGIADVEVAVLRRTRGRMFGRRHRKWRRKRLFSAMWCVCERVPHPRLYDVPAPPAIHKV